MLKSWQAIKRGKIAENNYRVAFTAVARESAVKATGEETTPRHETKSN